MSDPIFNCHVATQVTDEASLSIATSHPPFLVSLLVKDLGSLDAARKVPGSDTRETFRPSIIIFANKKLTGTSIVRIWSQPPS
jgi:hypothetical protein